LNRESCFHHESVSRWLPTLAKRFVKKAGRALPFLCLQVHLKTLRQYDRGVASLLTAASAIGICARRRCGKDVECDRPIYWRRSGGSRNYCRAISCESREALCAAIIGNGAAFRSVVGKGDRGAVANSPAGTNIEARHIFPLFISLFTLSSALKANSCEKLVLLALHQRLVARVFVEVVQIRRFPHRGERVARPKCLAQPFQCGSGFTQPVINQRCAK
jgi:hypothetical protein